MDDLGFKDLPETYEVTDAGSDGPKDLHPTDGTSPDLELPGFADTQDSVTPDTLQVPDTEGQDTPFQPLPCVPGCNKYELCDETTGTCTMNPECSGDFCIDAPEGALKVQAPGGLVYMDRYEYPNVAGQHPQGNFGSLASATLACLSVRKRLCLAQELSAACLGVGQGPYPYGVNYSALTCNTEFPFLLDKAGANPFCTNSSGIVDLVGNAAEWSAGGLLFGGSVYDGASATCALIQAPEDQTHPEARGIRCCISPEEDLDNDGYPASQDCDNLNKAVYPGAPELCDGLDNDCDGEVDGAPDQDGDGYNQCQDCNDNSASINPGALDMAGDGHDLNCDGFDGVDADSDGRGAIQFGGNDCNDADPEIHPGRPEICDGLDNDCDGTVDKNLAANECNDSNACTVDGCDVLTGRCTQDPLSCSDGNVCTDDSCDVVLGCRQVKNHAPCNDNDACTAEDVCSNGSCKGSAVDCGDDNLCTDDSCNSVHGCINTGNVTECDDNDACTGPDYCSGGACQGGPTVVCNDKNPCTDESCNPLAGCVTSFNTKACDDANACTLNDLCGAGKCKGTTRSCNDDNLCTDDSCLPKLGCIYLNNSALCDDADACTEPDGCQLGVCQGGPSVDCDDGNPCTDDSCDGALGCKHLNNTAPCSDGNACTQGDRCGNGLCSPGVTKQCNDGNPCTDDSCDRTTGSCVLQNHKRSCSDSDPCTLGDTCLDGACTPGAATLDCNDGNPCTEDYCQQSQGCVHGNKAGTCEDGNPCTAGDSCVGGECVPGADTCGCQEDVDCLIHEDGNLCNGKLRCDTTVLPHVCVVDPTTVVACNPANDSTCVKNLCKTSNGLCYLTPINENLACEDNNPCTGGDFCKAGYCQSGLDFCCHTDTECAEDDDGDLCNGIFRCNKKVMPYSCQLDSSSLVYCDSSANSTCQASSCVPSTGECKAFPKNEGAACSDKNGCTQDDTCVSGKCLGTACTDLGLFCVSGACVAKACTGGERACTTDFKYKTCNQDGLSWGTETSCGSGKYCQDGLCKTQVCSPGAKLCLDSLAGTCNSAGSGLVDGGSDCDALGQLCVNGACQSETPCEDDGACDWDSYCFLPYGETTGKCLPHYFVGWPQAAAANPVPRTSDGLYYGRQDKTIFVFSIGANGLVKARRILEDLALESGQYFEGMAISPDGKKLIADINGITTLVLLDPKTGKILGYAPSGITTLSAVLPDGSGLATTDGRIVDLETFATKRTIPSGKVNFVPGADLAYIGKTLYSTTDYSVVKTFSQPILAADARYDSLAHLPTATTIGRYDISTDTMIAQTWSFTDSKAASLIMRSDSLSIIELSSLRYSYDSFNYWITIDLTPQQNSYNYLWFHDFQSKTTHGLGNTSYFAIKTVNDTSLVPLAKFKRDFEYSFSVSERNSIIGRKVGSTITLFDSDSGDRVAHIAPANLGSAGLARNGAFATRVSGGTSLSLFSDSGQMLCEVQDSLATNLPVAAYLGGQFYFALSQEVASTTYYSIVRANCNGTVKLSAPPFQANRMVADEANRRLGIGGDLGLLSVVDVDTMFELFTVAAHGSTVLDLAFSPDGTMIASAGSDKFARVWDSSTGTLLAEWSLGAYTGSVAFSPDGSLLASASDGPLQIRRVSDFSVVWQGKTSSARSVRFLDNRRLAINYITPGIIRVLTLPDLSN